MRIVILLVLASVALAAAAAEVREQRSPTTGLASWKVEDRGFSLELLQTSSDFVQAFYGSRGMPQDLLENIAQYCVFGTVVRNESPQSLSYRVAQWRYITADGKEHPVKTKTEWLDEWGARGLTYMWSLLPDDQTLEVGDWNQGLTTVAAPRGSPFNLIYTWSQGGQTYTGTVPGLRCGPMALPAP